MDGWGAASQSILVFGPVQQHHSADGVYGMSKRDTGSVPAFPLLSEELLKETKKRSCVARFISQSLLLIRNSHGICCKNRRVMCVSKQIHLKHP